MSSIYYIINKYNFFQNINLRNNTNYSIKYSNLNYYSLLSFFSKSFLALSSTTCR